MKEINGQTGMSQEKVIIFVKSPSFVPQIFIRKLLYVPRKYFMIHLLNS